jgi:hypothetical protein
LYKDPHTRPGLYAYRSPTRLPVRFSANSLQSPRPSCILTSTMPDVYQLIDELISHLRSFLDEVPNPSKRLFPILAGILSVLSIPSPIWLLPAAPSRTPSSCPDYTTYSTIPHPPYSSGPLRLPSMRPAPGCRTFNSSAVEVSPRRRPVQLKHLNPCLESD